MYILGWDSEQDIFLYYFPRWFGRCVIASSRPHLS